MASVREIRAQRGVGNSVAGEALVSREPFSPRYDLNRKTGVVTRPGHPLEGKSIANKVLVCSTAKGGVAGGWAFFDLKARGLAPLALIFDVTNTVMVQGAVAAGIPIMDQFAETVVDAVASGDQIEVLPQEKCIRVVRSHDA